MRLILIRHYKTEFNVSRQIMGWGDSPRAADWLDDMEYIERTLQLRGIRPDAICSSALGRARSTAEYFAELLHVPDVDIAPQLNEINYGALFREHKSQVSRTYPQHKKDPDFVYPGGESFRQLQIRNVAFIRSMAAQRCEQTVLCVAHAGVVRALLSHFLELDYAAQLKRKVSHRYVGVLCFESDRCATYDEWGRPSGFVTDAQVELPFTRKTA